MKAIEFKDVWEKYRIKFIQDRNVSWEEIWVLKDINLCVEQGQVLGVIGHNGAGKTTLLKLIAGMIMPDKGDVAVRGKVSTLMELGAGFNSEFTGRENIMLNARTYGIGAEVLDEQMEKIISFAEIGKFIDAPVKYYSLGMYLRLAFALAVFVDPDVLLIDDVLAVGDEEAQIKCAKKILDLKKEGKTLVVVSHDMSKIRSLCGHVILLDESRIIFRGSPDEVIAYYMETVGKREEERRRALEKAHRELVCSQQEIKSGASSFSIDAEQKKIQLFYGGKEVSQDWGFSAVFQTSQKFFHSREAYWETRKISDQALVLTMKFPNQGLTQIFNFSFPEENLLDVKVEMVLKTPILFVHQDFCLVLKDVYKTWVTVLENGSLDVGQGFGRTYPVRWKNNKVSSVALQSVEKSGYPDIVFKSFSHPGARILSLNKTTEKESRWIGLISSLIIPSKSEPVKAGHYAYFHGQVALGRGIHLQDPPSGLVLKLDGAGFNFVFDNGKGRIFSGEKELTSGLSLYTSLRSSGIWLDSFQALWQINEKTDKKIVATGHWPHLPVSQRWQILMEGKNRISWMVETQIHEETVLEIEQANLMLSTSYKHWKSAPSYGGDFSEDFTEDYDILPFRFWYGQTELMEAIGDGLPNLVFKREPGNSLLKGLVENTDSFYRARLLQYQKANIEKVRPGRYSFYKGVIEIGL
ncbi:MAG: ABC transporter ATP-binding protein [Candidatus Omnitrophica bacterium]|nr:ABC transporter ATP-binding protein [Candidatus Omnitrophota bacterium]